MNKKIPWILILLFSRITAMADVIFVSPKGDDTNRGTKEKPLSTIQKAQSLVSPGDTVYVRGGTYLMNESQISSHAGIKAYVIFLDKSGTENKRINYFAYPGENPVFDFSNVKPANYRVHAFEITGNWLHLKGLEVTGVQVTITNVNTQSICFSNDGGSNNIYEQLRMHDGQGIGFFLTSGSNDLILNCDAWRNYDYTSQNGGGRNGGNVDGFGNHPSKGSVNNVFRGCRAWFNSDDGYDCINAFESTVFENCWAFYNGYSVGFIGRADGNGFKAGGYAARPDNELPIVVPRNTIHHCLSVMNKANGFYANHHVGGSNWYNNTAYKNGNNFNMTNRVGLTKDGHLVDGPGSGHVLKNNISLNPNGKNADLTNCDPAKSTIDHNSFLNKDFTVSVNDFISVDIAQLTASRKADGSLPDIDFMRPKPNTALVDSGVDVGLPYKGKKPDLGCFETSAK